MTQEPDPTPSADAQAIAPAAEPAEPEVVAAAFAASDAAAAEAPAAPPAPPQAPAEIDLSAAATGARLSELFPALFVGPDGKGIWKAIKLRIHADIQARAPGQFSKRALGIFFSRYTTTTAYLKALAAPGAQRHDLDGQPAGEIAEEHRSAAAEEVARRQAIAAERRAAFRKPPARPPATDRSVASEGEARAAREPRERPAAAEHRPEGPRPRPRRDGVHEGSRDGAPRRPPQGPRPASRGDAPPRREARPAPHTDATPPAAVLPTDPMQRERAMLLRAFEASPLSKANFCTLKRISEAELDAALAQARAERR
jgi:sRNA-binding protein